MQHMPSCDFDKGCDVYYTVPLIGYGILSISIPPPSYLVVMKKHALPRNKKTLHGLIADLAKIQLRVDTLPPLSDVEKAKLDHSLAIEQLYYSSKIEGTKLSHTMINRAIHGRKLPTP
jgi:hypothetical protein